MNFIYKTQDCLKNFREIGLVGPCFEKSIQTNKMIAKLATMPPIEKGKNAGIVDKKTQKLASYSKKPKVAKTQTQHRSITTCHPVSTREL